VNRIAYTAFVAFWAALAALLAFAALSGREARPAPPPERAAEGAAPAGPAATPETGAPGGGEAGLRPVSLEELARHEGPESCWKAIHGKVYDVTGFIDLHPTPPSVMLEWCGRESTEAWQTKGYGRPHSEAAEELLADYLVGRLETPTP